MGSAETNHPDLVSFEPTRTTSVPEVSSPPESFTRIQGGSSLPNPLEPLLSIRTTSVSKESSPSESFTRVQGGSSLPNLLEPLLFIGNHACSTVLLEFRVVRLRQTHLNHCCPLEIMAAGWLYSRSGSIGWLCARSGSFDHIEPRRTSLNNSNAESARH